MGTSGEEVNTAAAAAAGPPGAVKTSPGAAAAAASYAAAAAAAAQPRHSSWMDSGPQEPFAPQSRGEGLPPGWEEVFRTKRQSPNER
mmetsp:Transcript_94114/g.206118  ORF Transcript_94114/g.206118 Transcript_94114/m.206118 type:complete len:87 (-) Transcript_94114:6-266(-)